MAVLDIHSDYILIDVCNRLSYPVLLINSEHMPIWANKKFLKLHHMTLEKLQEVQERQWIHDKLTNMLNNDQYALETAEEKRYFQAVSSRIKLQDKKILMICFFDISKQKKLQTELYAEKEMFKQISERVPEGIVLFAENILYSNPAFEKLVGYSGTDLQSKNVEELVDVSQRKIFTENIQKLQSLCWTKIEPGICSRNQGISTSIVE
jgi:PAS domain-containing protein